MDSSGRGEESTDAYRGVVLPSAQNQQPPLYGEQHVQPAGGSPWGSPGPQQMPGQAPQAPHPGHAAPPAADATQMLPPYPAGAPPLAPPGAAPAIPPDGPGQGPEATQVLRVQPAGPPPAAPPAMPAAPAPGGPVAADATQMLPPYPGGDPSPAPGGGPAGAGAFPPPGYDQGQPQQQPGQPTFEQAYGAGPGYPGQDQQPGGEIAGQEFPGQGYGGQDYPGYPGQDAPGAPAYTDPGAGGGFGGPQQPPAGPEHDSDYDHLFRHDVPSPAPMRPHIIQRPDPQQAQAQPQYPGRPGHGHGNLPGGFDASYDDDDRRGGRRMSPKVIIGIVVAGCVVAGLVVGSLLNSGGDASANNSPDKGGASASSTANPAAGDSGGTATADPGEQQAKELDALLQTSGDSRSQVISAVGSIKNCQDLDNAASDLRAAKTQRDGLVTKLGSLSLDRLADNAALSDALTRAWRASAAADSHYASWAEQAKGKKVCKGGHARGTEETAAGNRESGTATEQKKRAVKLWNTIADKYGLTKRTYGQL